MNFFEHQDRARRNTRRLVFFFVLAVIGITLAVTVVVGVLLGGGHDPSTGRALTPFSPQWMALNWSLVAAAAVITVLFISLASLSKIASLRSGGGVVARSLGGTLLTPDVNDFKRRRLYNVVEEMAVASGVPVPEVYVLENESGINAFAAGFTPGDAALGITRGTIEKLNRDELQGVVAHEFSHVLNGDMRLNMKLMGVIFGILLLGITGRLLLRGSFYAGGMRRRGKDSGGGQMAMLALGASLMAIGFIGVFFGRLMQAAVSRQREFLADASAVQFTRNPEGIAGALKKIGGYSDGSKIRNPHGEEVGHMLFGPGASLSGAFATHPPLEERIRLLDPSFDPREFQRLRDSEASALESDAAAGFAGYEDAPGGVAAMAGASATSAGRGAPGTPGGAAATAGGAAAPRKFSLSPEQVIADMGAPGDDHVRYATQLLAAIPPDVRAASSTPGHAIAVMFGLLLDARQELRTRQLEIVTAGWGRSVAEESAALQPKLRALGAGFRMPLVDLAFPVVKRRPPEQRQRFVETVRQLVEIDQHVDIFEFTVSKILRAHLEDADDPGKARDHGSLSLRQVREEALVTLSVLAGVGTRDKRAELAALNAGLGRLPGFGSLGQTPPPAPLARLDTALTRLDDLEVNAKRALVEAMVATVADDQQVTVEEGELLRAFCEALHCPLPPLGV